MESLVASFEWTETTDVAKRVEALQHYMRETQSQSTAAAALKALVEQEVIDKSEALRVLQAFQLAAQQAAGGEPPAPAPAFAAAAAPTASAAAPAGVGAEPPGQAAAAAGIAEPAWDSARGGGHRVAAGAESAVAAARPGVVAAGRRWASRSAGAASS